MQICQFATGDVEDVLEPVARELVGRERQEVVGVVARDVAQPRAEHARRLVLRLSRGLDRDGEVGPVREPQVAEELAAVRHRVRAHAAIAGRHERAELADRRARRVEELLGPVRPQPLLEHFAVSVVAARVRERHLMGAERALDALAVDHRRAGPALRRAEHDHRPSPARRGNVAARCPLADVVDPADARVHGCGHRLVDRGGIVARDDVRLVPVPAEERVEILRRDAREQRGVGDLVLVELEDRYHAAVTGGVQELRRVPARRQRAGLRLAVADDAEHDQPRVVERGADGVQQCVAELAAFVERARCLGRAVARDPAGEGELPEERRHAGGVLSDVAVTLGVRALEPRARVRARAAVARSRDEHRVEIAFDDQAVRVRPHQVEARNGPEVPEQAGLHVFGAQRLGEQRVRHEVDLPDREVVGCAPPGVEPPQPVGAQRSRGVAELVCARRDRFARSVFVEVGGRVAAHAGELFGHVGLPPAAATASYTRGRIVVAAWAP